MDILLTFETDEILCLKALFSVKNVLLTQCAISRTDAA